MNVSGETIFLYCFQFLPPATSFADYNEMLWVLLSKWSNSTDLTTFQWTSFFFNSIEPQRNNVTAVFHAMHNKRGWRFRFLFLSDEKKVVKVAQSGKSSICLSAVFSESVAKVTVPSGASSYMHISLIYFPSMCSRIWQRIRYFRTKARTWRPRTMIDRKTLRKKPPLFPKSVTVRLYCSNNLGEYNSEYVECVFHRVYFSTSYFDRPCHFFRFFFINYEGSLLYSLLVYNFCGEIFQDEGDYVRKISLIRLSPLQVHIHVRVFRCWLDAFLSLLSVSSLQGYVFKPRKFTFELYILNFKQKINVTNTKKLDNPKSQQ